MVSRDESNGTLRFNKFSKLQNNHFRCTTVKPYSDQNSDRLLRRCPRHQIHNNYSLISAQINPKFSGPYILAALKHVQVSNDRLHSLVEASNQVQNSHTQSIARLETQIGQIAATV